MDTQDTFKTITQALADHYQAAFEKHGATPKGVDWGTATDVALRYNQMLAVIPESQRQQPWEILDVGCGYGGLVPHAAEKGFQLRFTGIEASARLTQAAARTYPTHEWVRGDVLEMPETRQFDFVVCNGILTQKLQTSHLQMNAYARALITKMFALCRRGVAFNVMSTLVNFQSDNLYYRSPVEMLATCLELTRKVKLDHSYPLYEYTVYLYRE